MFSNTVSYKDNKQDLKEILQNGTLFSHQKKNVEPWSEQKWIEIFEDIFCGFNLKIIENLKNLKLPVLGKDVVDCWHVLI